MAYKKSTYVEPKGYFNADMLKAAKEFDKKQKQEAKANKTNIDFNVLYKRHGFEKPVPFNLCKTVDIEPSNSRKDKRKKNRFFSIFYCFFEMKILYWTQ